MKNFEDKKQQLETQLESLTEKLASEKSLRLEQVNQKELDRIKETE